MEKFEKMIKKTCQYMLNAVQHIFSSIHFCVNPSFFLIKENHIFEGTKSIDILQSTLCFSYKFVRNNLKF